jgi:hypothetical protein
MNKVNTISTKTAPAAKAAPAPKAVNLGGLDGSLIYKATGKVARAAHNAERHSNLNGLTVTAAIATRQVNATDVKYDVAKGFITLVKA